MVSWLMHSGSNYLYLDQISMVLMMFEPLKFDWMCKKVGRPQFIESACFAYKSKQGKLLS